MTDLLAAQQKTADDLAAIDRTIADQQEQLKAIVSQLAELSSKIDALKSRPRSHRFAPSPFPGRLSRGHRLQCLPSRQSGSVARRPEAEEATARSDPDGSDLGRGSAVAPDARYARALNRDQRPYQLPRCSRDHRRRRRARSAAPAPAAPCRRCRKPARPAGAEGARRSLSSWRQRCHIGGQRDHVVLRTAFPRSASSERSRLRRVPGLEFMKLSHDVGRRSSCNRLESRQRLSDRIRGSRHRQRWCPPRGLREYFSLRQASGPAHTP